MKSQKIKNDFSAFWVFFKFWSIFPTFEEENSAGTGFLGFQAPTFFQLCHDDYGIIIPYYGNDGWMVGLQARGDDDRW